MKKMSVIFQSLSMIYGTALMTAFFSEMFFFNEGPIYGVIDNLHDPMKLFFHIFELGLWYSLAVAPVLWAIVYFNVRNLWSFFLVACLFGLLVEGLVVPALYFELPYSLLWVVSSWHPLISFMLAWWGIRYVMQRGKAIPVAGLVALLGVVWGVWATYIIGAEVDQEVMRFDKGSLYAPLSSFEFFGTAVFTTSIWVLGSLLVDKGAKCKFVINKVGKGIIAFSLLAQFIFIALVTSILSVVFLLFALVLWVGLARNKKVELRENIFSEFKPIKVHLHFIMFLMPLVATGTYQLMVQNDLKAEAYLYAVPLCFVGVVLFVGSYIMLFRAKVKG